MNPKLDPTIIGDPQRDPAFALLIEGQRRDARLRRNLRVAFGIALAWHLLLSFIDLPGDQRIVAAAPRTRQVVTLVNMPRFAHPQARPQLPKRPDVVKVPIPDPTPFEPEPIRAPEVTPAVVALGTLESVFDDDLPGPPPPESRAVRAGSTITEPRKIFDVKPDYPEKARMARVQGTVLLDVTLDERGLVSEVRVLKPVEDGLTEAAVAAVKQWRYEPSRLDGKPVSVLLTIAVTFNLA
jgi:TonB family protein